MNRMQLDSALRQFPVNVAHMQLMFCLQWLQHNKLMTQIDFLYTFIFRITNIAAGKKHQ